jgi:hypothetical protein
VKKLFLRTFAIAAGLQTFVFLAFVLGAAMLPKLEFLLTWSFYLYTPTVYVIWLVGHFTGESAIVNPIVFGIPLGILVYSLVLALSLSYVRAKRDRVGFR